MLIHGRYDGGHTERNYTEMKAHDLAIKKVKEYAQDRERTLTESDIRDFNKIILKEPYFKKAQPPDGATTQKKIIPGEYKTHPNHVVTATGEVFKFTEPSDVPADRRPFTKIFSALQRSNVLKEFRYLEEGYLIALDGTGHFSSSQVKCKDCIEKKSRSGEITYHHQLLGASIVHPKFKSRSGEVTYHHQLLGASIVHPKFRYILGIKPDRHRALFEQFKLNKKHGLVGEKHTLESIGIKVKKTVGHTFRFLNGLSLNHSNPDIKVNILEYSECTEYANPEDDKKNIGTRVKKFIWITDIELTEDNVAKIMAAGRARRKVENETFQTLKAESAYNLEHSYGHGKENLCTIFGMLAMLAFLIDQAQEIACPLFRKALAGKRAKGKKRTLWGPFKSAVEWFVLDTWETLLKLAAEIMEVASSPQANSG